MGSHSYIKEAVRVAESHKNVNCIQYSESIKESINTPFSHTYYRPELDASKECGSVNTNMYQNLIGILKWCCEIGRIDILLETLLLSQYLAQSCIGHVQ